MAAISGSLVLSKNSELHPSSGLPLKQRSLVLGGASSVNVPIGLNGSNNLQFSASRSRKPLTVRAVYRNDEGPGSTGLFVGGFILGGLIVGALGCVFAPEISKALAGADRKDLMRKLPKFIYDEEKALETRKVLAEKIAQLNSAIDGVSSQLRSEDDTPNGAASNTDEFEATV
ncbi:PREDICTED: uncharacterized protein LOC104806873 isoform X2 [Tarenaya hassleriana]|uniref:uncharacterized protein LOC104806873 isoform X2 n=1 Tax=Tarenaya hassleriana TaxID=28532 RepID=UPI00053C3F05|nr:PREDICTED: uncharacterized protein LOC104806873 isoform X2 [Tarenaya hassleriana]